MRESRSDTFIQERLLAYYVASKRIRNKTIKLASRFCGNLQTPIIHIEVLDENEVENTS